MGFEPTNPDNSRAAQPNCNFTPGIQIYPQRQLMREERPLIESGALDRSATPTLIQIEV